MSQLQQENFAGLRTLVSKHENSAKWFILLHGYGASAEDLAPLRDLLHTHAPCNWAFIEGPLAVPLGPHMEGRAWFPIDPERMMKMAMTGQPVSLRDTPPSSAYFDVAEKVALAISEITSSEDLIVGGFSQGAMLSLQVTQLVKTVKSLVLLSGSLPGEQYWSQQLSNSRKIPFFQSHGRMDNVLSFADAEALHELLLNSDFAGKFCPFQGGHEIPVEVVAELNSWLRAN